MKNLESFSDANNYYHGLEYIYVFKNNKWYFSNSSVNKIKKIFNNNNGQPDLLLSKGEQDVLAFSYDVFIPFNLKK